MSSSVTIIPDMPIEEYHAHPAISKSGLKTVIAKTPAHYIADRRKVPDAYKKTSQEKVFGQAFHTYLLEPHKFEKVYMLEPKAHPNTKAYKRLEVEAKAAGRVFLTADELQSLVSMRQAVLRHPVAGKHLGARPRKQRLIEHSIFFKDEESGVDCKVRPDVYLKDTAIILDPKTTRDASEGSFARDVLAYGYDIQYALYTEGVKKAFNEAPKDMLFIACEKVEPFGVGVYRLDATYKAVGYNRMRAALDVVAQCEREKSWPGYNEEIVDLRAPYSASQLWSGFNTTSVVKKEKK